MNRHRFQILAAQVALTLTVSACNAGGTSGAGSTSATGSSTSSSSSTTGSPSSPSSTPPPVSTSAGTLALSSAGYSVPQSASTAILSVTRTGGTSGAVSVAYATRFGTALDGINYGAVNGTLSWASGDAAAKTIQVPVLAATPFSGSKTFSVTLSKAVGAALGTASATVSIVGDAGAVSANARSIRSWVACDGTSDDALGAAKAFAAAANGAFTLLVDCPVRIHVGTDIGRTIFIDNGTKVQFAGAGKFILDNELIPTFVIADSTNIDLEGWNIEYQGGIPVNPQVTAYLNGKPMSNGVAPGNAFNDVALTDWLAAHRGIKFDNYVHSNWSGATNQCSVLMITGDSSNITVNDMLMAVPPGTPGHAYIPVAFTLSQNFKANQTVGSGTPMTSQYVSLPHNLTFSNIRLDGTYMGWVGNARSVTFSNITSTRYADLMDANGNNVGGIKKWFAPPHLFYLSYVSSHDPLLVNSDITISDVNDQGVRTGTARDKGGSDSMSGYALSLKIACTNCSVTNYNTARPDGFMDVLISSNLSVSNVTATYDSSFLNHVYPGWRFPSAPYHDVSFQNVSITDTAAESLIAPIGDANMSSNTGVALNNVNATVQYWSAGSSLPVPVVGGSGKSVSVSILDNRRSLRIAHAETDVIKATLQTSPANLSAGSKTQLTWSSQGAQACAASDAWAGSLQSSGARTVPLAASGGYTFVMA